MNSANRIASNINVVCSSGLSGRAVMLRCFRMLDAWAASLDLPTAAVMIIGGLLVAASIAATVVMLILALPYGGGPTDFGTQPGLASTVVARSPSGMAAD